MSIRHLGCGSWRRGARRAVGKTHWPSGPWRGGGGVGAGAPYLCHLEREIAVNAAFTAPGGGKAWRAVAGIGAVRRRAPEGLAEVQCSPDGASVLGTYACSRRIARPRRRTRGLQSPLASAGHPASNRPGSPALRSGEIEGHLYLHAHRKNRDRAQLGQSQRTKSARPRLLALSPQARIRFRR